MGELDTAKYISLTTFKRDGIPVATPVWVTGSGGRYAFITGATSWKARRLANNAAVEVQPCDMRGRVAPGAARYTGTGEVTSDPAALTELRRALAAKYGLQYKILNAVEGVRKLVRRGGDDGRVAIYLSIPDAG
jgi:PPOX class probable F420-dependent enzyme